MRAPWPPPGAALPGRTRTSVLASILAVALVLAPGARADWPQWRGAAGLGVSDETGLPIELGRESPALRWRADVRGEGISSPIVSNGRVFVSTAYPGQEQSMANGLRVGTVGVLAPLLLFLLARAVLRRTRDEEGPRPTGSRRFLLGLDALAVGLATAAFVVLAVLVCFSPQSFWSRGVRGEMWFFTGGIGLAGLVAAVGWFRPRSPWRVLGALLVLGAAAYTALEIPFNQFGHPFKWRFRWVMVSPALAGAAWHVLVFATARAGAVGRPRFANPLAALGLTAVSVVLFVTYNHWQPRAGLMRAVICYDVETGEELWDAPLFVAPEEQKYPINSFATPTPCTDGELVFAYFGSGYACLDMDGNVLWQGVDEEYAPNTRYGCGASPIVYGDSFIILQEKEYVRPSYVMALDKRTGKELWKVNPQYASDSYLTPILVPREDTTQLITVSGEILVAHDPENGEQLWSLSIPVRQMVPSISYRGDLLLVAGGTHSRVSASGIRLSGKGEDTRTELLWQTTRTVPTVSSPVLVDDCFFTITEGGIVVCYDPETGEVHWKERVEGVFWSSLVAGDGKVYAVDEAGITTVLAARPEFEVLGTSRLDEEGCIATPAISDGRIFIRSADALYCFGAS